MSVRVPSFGAGADALPRFDPGGFPAADPGELARLAFRDDLTGLYNRRYLHRALKHYANGWATGHSLSLLMIDVDAFKQVNDTHGHLVGDQVLVSIAQRMQLAVRNDESIVRYAGDEFMVLLPDMGLDVARRIGERVSEAVRCDPVATTRGGQPVSVTLSVGIAISGAAVPTPSALIDAADRALYASKEQGRNRVSVAGDHAAPETPRIHDVLAGFPCPRLVGRELELTRCESLGQMGETGPTTLAVIEGEGGLGKTRLLRELATRRADDGRLTLWGSCRPELRTTPYAPLVDLLRRHFRRDASMVRELGQRLSADQRAALIGRVPELSPRVANGPTDEPASRAHLFTAFGRILGYLAAERRACVMLDDLQYADAATLRLLSSLLVKKLPAGKRGLEIFATVATDTKEAMEGSDSAYAHFRASARRHRRAAWTELGPLDMQHVALMIDACFPGHQFPADLPGKVFRVCKGNPLFTEEVLILLALSGFLVSRGDMWTLEQRATLSIPDNLGQVLMAHLGELDEETSRALLQASVIGSSFSVDLLRKVLQVNEGRAFALADKAVRYRLLNNPNPETMEEMSFVNRRLQELTYEFVGDELKREVHRKVAGIKQESGEVNLDEALSEIAYHYERSEDVRAGRGARRLAESQAGKLFRQEEADTGRRKPTPTSSCRGRSRRHGSTA